MLRAKNRAAKRRAHNRRPRFVDEKSTFLEHLQELRKRLCYIAVAVIAGGAIAYTLHEPITAALLAPANGQQFIYTTPGGGFDFLFRLCLYGGILLSIPVIVYQLLRYLQPLMGPRAARFLGRTTAWSALLALAGVLFGYFLGLPSALHFLLQEFSSEQIQALISIQSYLSFVMLYLIGSAMIFQVPLLMLFVNRIKPLPPKKLLAGERWFILLAFVFGAVVNPSPNVQDQLLITVPMILTYQVGIVLVWRLNRTRRRPKAIAALLQQDAQVRAARQARLRMPAQPARQRTIQFQSSALTR